MDIGPYGPCYKTFRNLFENKEKSKRPYKTLKDLKIRKNQKDSKWKDLLHGYNTLHLFL